MNNIIFQQKQKVLRNLDKICLEPVGYLANAELLKDDQAVLLYNKGMYGSDRTKWKEWEDKSQKVEIEGEIIDLRQFITSDYYEEIRTALINEIKQNPQNWEIKEPIKGSDSGPVVQDKFGRRHWKEIALHKSWAEIEACLNNNSIINSLIRYFSSQNIKKIELISSGLLIEYNNNSTESETMISEQGINNSSELQEVKNYLQETNKQRISQQELINMTIDKTIPIEKPKNNNALWMGGIAIVLVLGVVIRLLVKNRVKKNK